MCQQTVCAESLSSNHSGWKEEILIRGLHKHLQIYQLASLFMSYFNITKTKKASLMNLDHMRTSFILPSFLVTFKDQGVFFNYIPL